MRPSLLLLLAVLAGSCSLTEYHHDSCRGPADCRAAFGFGSVCGHDGLCSAAGAPNPRCTHTYPVDLYTRPADYRDWVVMGAILNEDDPSDQASENAIMLAAKQVDDLGGLAVNTTSTGDGGAATPPKFAVVFCTAQQDPMRDTLTPDQAAAADALYLGRDLGLPIILGPTTSVEAQAAYVALFPMSATSVNGPVFISHSATSPLLTTLDTHDLFWRTVPPDSEQGRVIAQDILMRHPGARVAEIVETGPYGDGLKMAFAGSFTGMTTVTPFNVGNATMRDSAVLATGMMAGSYDEVLFISSDFMDEPAFLTYAASLGSYASLNIFLTDTAGSSPSFLSASGSASTLFPHVRGTRFALASGTVYEQFVASYSAAYMSAPNVRSYQYAPTAYDAAWLAFVGSAWSYNRTGADAGHVDGSAVADGLHHISASGVTPVDLLPANWSRLEAAAAGHTNTNVNGSSGQLDYDPTTEETSGPVEVWRIDTTGTTPTIVVDHTVNL